jgi:hypothetical protein
MADERGQRGRDKDRTRHGAVSGGARCCWPGSVSCERCNRQLRPTPCNLYSRLGPEVGGGL